MLRRGRVGRPITLVVAAALALVASGCTPPAPSPSASPAPTLLPTPMTYVCRTLLEPQPPPTAARGRSAGVGFVTPDLGRTHATDPTEPIEYGHCPPTSGDHLSGRGLGPIAPGFYGPEGEPRPGGWVHNLEHGYVVALYSCRAGCPSDEELTELRRFLEETPPTEGAEQCGFRKLIVARFDEMATRFALVAWDRAHLTDTFDREVAAAFAQQHVDGPQAPEQFGC